MPARQIVCRYGRVLSPCSCKPLACNSVVNNVPYGMRENFSSCALFLPVLVRCRIEDDPELLSTPTVSPGRPASRHTSCANGSRSVPRSQLPSTSEPSSCRSQQLPPLGAVAIIPSKRNRKQLREYDKTLYKQRNRIECCFSRLKHFRRFATRYEKLKTNFKVLVALACS